MKNIYEEHVIKAECTLICFAVELDLVGLHHLLNRLSNITQTHINAGVLLTNKKTSVTDSEQIKPERCVCVYIMNPTLIPVLVASLTASSSLSYFGLNVTVKAQSMIRPADRHQAVKNNQQ